MNGEPKPLIVDDAWLTQHIEQVRLFDVRLLSRYVRGHIPGAVHFDLDLVVRDNDHFSIAHPDLLHDLLEENGITPEMPVVIYDDTNGFDAARLFWTLEYAGHTDVRILDGGIRAWRANNRPISLEAPHIQRTTYAPFEIDQSRHVDGDWILHHLENDALTLIDTRTEQEFTGEHIFSLHGGHIPGALHVEWQQNFRGGQYLPVDQLSDLYRNVPKTNHVITYCQFGYRAAANYVALRVLGYPYVALYDDSWSEWGDRHDVPLVAMAWGDTGS